MTNEDIIKGKWRRLKASIHKKWNGLTRDELDQHEGCIDTIESLIHERYGLTHEVIRKEMRELVRYC